MLRKAGECHFTSVEQCEEYVRCTVQVADACDLTPEDRATLLPSIFTALSNKQVQMEAVEVGGLGQIMRPQG